MGIHNAQAISIRPVGLSDAVDGSNAPAGAMAILKDLIPNPTTAYQYVPRPASVSAYNFADFTTPTALTCLLVVGTRAYGFVSTARFAGHDEPFIYDLRAGSFIALANVTSANTPLTQSTTGDWSPPNACMVTPGRIIFTHPGYNGTTDMIGWIDISSFSSTGVTGNTHTSTTIDGLSDDVITINGWQVGYRITGSGIPTNTFITAINAAGTSITISQATSTSVSATPLTVTGGTPAAPLYGAGNTSPFPLVAKPLWVAQFNGRAYYAVLNGVAWSDSLLPLQVSNADQALTLGDNTLVTTLSGLPLNNTVTGGTVQALIVFKGAGAVYQITGDQTTTLSVNAVDGAVGTLAPNTLCNTPQGIAYIAPDGLRLVLLNGTCSAPIGQAGEGVNFPFLNALNPSRMCMSYNEDTIRVSLQNNNVNGQPFQEYWYHTDRKLWTGPHSFPAVLIQAYTGGSGGNTFIIAPNLHNPGSPGASLYQSPVLPSAFATYTENTVAMTFAWQPVLSPDNSQASMNCIVESMLGFALPVGLVMTLIAMNEGGLALDTLTFSGPGSGGSIWDSFDWGAADWGMAIPPFAQAYLPWHLPLVFKQMSLLVTGPSISGFVIGNMNFKYESLGYPIT